jgi:DNA-binding GntR family transcriptional regulator
LAQAIGISRTPVREALKLLEREGLVRTFAARGAFVADVSAADVAEIYEVRMILEPYAARVAAARLTHEELGALQDYVNGTRGAVGQQRIDEASILDVHLHGTIVSATGNLRIKSILSQMDDQVHRIRSIALRDAGRMQHTLDEHKRIVAALVARNEQLAEEEMYQHLAGAREFALSVGVSQRAGSAFSFKTVESGLSNAAPKSAP